MTLIRIVLFCIATLGSFELLRLASRDKINLYFLPGLTIAIQATILFFAGILNVLPDTCKLLYLVGGLGFLYVLYRRKSISFLKDYVTVGYLFLFLVMIIMAFYLKGRLFTHYDNFSHWAIVIKRMLTAGRLPNFSDSIITFQEYPLGSASYIYFFVKLIGEAEANQMLAQIYMITAALLPLFSFVRKNKFPAAIIMLSLTNFLFLCNIRPTELLVDTLLPIMGISGLLFVMTHCKEDLTGFKLFCAACYMVQLMQIKNSGIFFVLFIVLILCYQSFRQHKLKGGILASACPFLSLYLWQHHCQYVFVAAGISRHAMTLEYYQSMSHEKTAADIRNIIIAFSKYILTYRLFWVLLGFIAVVGILIRLGARQLWSRYIRIVLFSLILYVLYQLGNLAMYVISMPLEEANRLAGMNRYTMTILIAILYLNMIPVLELISDMQERRLMTVLCTLLFFGSFLGMQYIDSGKVQTVIQYQPYAGRRNFVEKAKATYSIPDYESYCMLIPEEDRGYANYLLMYVFQSTQVSSYVVTNPATLDELNCKYVINYDPKNTIIQDWIQEHYPEQYGNEAIILDQQ